MSHRQCLERRYKDKVATYTAHQCRIALVDIDATLALHRDTNYKGQITTYTSHLCIEQEALMKRLYSKQCK